ncbi:MAG TPA: hypothetical protein P5050_11120 [Bacteroidia bacterium]|nr:hypothetical protein [Sphingobacteriales bacterium]HPD65808.1 hypothetical protein [Bacteroidia bacterium]HRS59756.1 hypothetical protein [Bacteroidia bacterium]
MKSFKIIIVLLFVVTACNKEVEIAKDKNCNPSMRVTTQIPEGLTLFTIPEGFETPENYTGSFEITSQNFSFEYNGDNYTATIYLEEDTNGNINSIAFSDEIKDLFGLDEDDIIDGGFSEGFAAAKNANNLFDWLEWFFLGEKKVGDCQPGEYKWAWRDHWLVGNYGYHTICCSCPWGP